MGSQGRIPGPRARLREEGMKKSQRLIDLRLQGDRGRQRALAWGSRHVIALHRTGNRHCWYHVTPRAFVSSRGEIKGSAQATSWGLWSGKDEPRLNQNPGCRSAGDGQEQDACSGSHPQSPRHRDSGCGQEKQAGGQPARLGVTAVHWRARRIDPNSQISRTPVPEYEPEKPSHKKLISLSFTSIFLSTRKGLGEFGSQPRTGCGCCPSVAITSMLQDKHGLVFGEWGALPFLSSAACAETSLEFKQTFLMNYMKKGIFTTRVMDHDGV